MKQNVLREVAPVAAEMKIMAQSLARVRTGFMRESVFYDMVPSDLGFVFGAKADYTGYNEFGTRFIRAQPFIRPALEANQGKLIDAVLKGAMDAFQ